VLESENIIIYLMKFSVSMWFENNLHGLGMEFCKQTHKQRMTTFFKEKNKPKEGMEKGYNIKMITKMESEFKLTVPHFTRPNPMQICACAWIYRWTKNQKNGKQQLGHRASGRRTSRWWPLGRGPAFSKAKRSVIVAVVCRYIFLTTRVIL